MGTQLVRHTGGILIPTINVFLERQIAWAGPDDGGIRRGDREDTGDNEAAPDQLGYEPAGPAADNKTSIGELGEENTAPDRDYYDGMK